MSDEKKVRFGKPYLLPKTRDVVEYQFPFTVVDSSLIGAPEEESETRRHTVKIVIAGVDVACWGLSQPDLVKVLFEYGKRYIVEKLKYGTLSDKEELRLSDLNPPDKCPFDPSMISDPSQACINVPIPEKVLMQNQREIQLASSIIDARDNINAIFNQIYKERLFRVQERNLSEFFRETNSQEEFSYRVAALANITGGLNIPILRKITSTSDTSVKSISLLEAYLKAISDKGESVIKVFRNINQIRQGYPIHGDHAGVLESHKFFKIKYPVENHKEAWNTLLSNYLSALQDLLEIIRNDKSDSTNST